MKFIKADFLVFKVICWVGAFFAFAYLMQSYETVMNYVYTYGGSVWEASSDGKMVALQAHMNLANEGVIGYAILSGVAISAFMFIREFFSLTKEVQSLVHSEQLEEGVKKFV